MHVSFLQFLEGVRALLVIALTGTLLVACGGSDSSSSQDPGTGGGPGIGGGGDSGGGSSASVEVSPKDVLTAKQSITVSFDERMDGDSLELTGSLAESAVAQWSSDAETLTLDPEHYWKAGNQTLTVEVNTDAGASRSAEAEFDVRSAFSAGQEAVTVIGQPDFNSNEQRQGGLAAGANTLDLPMGPVEYAAEQDVLFVPDNGDSRVVAFFGIPDTNNANADFVLGQPDFTSSSGETSASEFRNPQWVTSDHGRLLVTDSESRRVVAYNEIPRSGPRDADVVIGQDSMTAMEISCDQQTTYTTHGHFVTPAGRLFVADSDGNRVLMWNQIPQQNGVPADLVLGQPDFESCLDHEEEGGPDDLRIFDHPTSIWSDDERVVIVDNENHRVLVWNDFPQENFAQPDIILGQSTIENVAPNDDDQDGQTDVGGTATARVMNHPWSVTFHGNQLFVTDSDNHRVLVWNGLPEENFQPADIVLGQANTSSIQPNMGNAAASASSLNGPRGAIVFGDKLFITDTENSRVLIFEAE